YSNFVRRSGLSVGRARIVGVRFLSRFGLLNPPIPRWCLLARRGGHRGRNAAPTEPAEPSRQKCRSYRKFVWRAPIVGVTFLSRSGLLNPPIPHWCLLARRWRAFAAEMPLLQLL